jgi:hypothetical protein
MGLHKSEIAGRQKLSETLSFASIERIRVETQGAAEQLMESTKEGVSAREQGDGRMWVFFWIQVLICKHMNFMPLEVGNLVVEPRLAPEAQPPGNGQYVAWPRDAHDFMLQLPPRSGR